MKLYEFFVLSILALSASIVHASPFQDTYQNLKRREALATPPQYYLDSVEAVPTDAAGESLPESPPVPVKVDAKSERKNASQLSASLFYDFESEHFKRLRKLAHADLDKHLADGISLDKLLAIAFERNPRLASLRQAWQAANERYPQAVYLQDVLSQYNAFTKQLRTKAGGQQHRERIAKTFPFPGPLSLKGDVIQRDVELALLEYQLGVRDMMTELRVAYDDCLYILKAVEITDAHRQLVTGFLPIANRRLSVSKGTSNDVIRAQIELNRLSDTLITLKKNQSTISARINTLLHRAPQAKLGVPEEMKDPPMPKSVDALLTSSLKEKQELRRIELKIQKMNLVIELGEKMTYPDPNIGTSDFEHRSGPSSTATFKETPRLMLRPWFGKDDAYLRELRKKRDSMKGHLADRRDAARFQVIRTHFQLDASRRQVELYQKTLLPQAKQNLNTSLIAYRSAKVEFITLMDAARLWLNFNLSLHGAMRDYRKHYALLEQVIGKRLEEDRSQKTED